MKILFALILAVPAFSEPRPTGRGNQTQRLGIGTGPSYQFDLLGTESPGASAVTRNLNIDNTISTIGSGGVHFNVYSNVRSNDTTDNTGNSAHYGSGVFRSSDTLAGRTGVITLESRLDSRAANNGYNYAFLPYIDKVYPTPTTADSSTNTAITIRMYGTTAADGAGTQTNQMTARGLYIEQPRIATANGGVHSVYIDGSTIPFYLAGRLGIGVTNPSEKLEISYGGANAAPVFRSGGSSNYMIFDMGRTATDALLGIAGGNDQFITGSTAGDVVLRSAGSDIYMTTNSGGAVFSWLLTAQGLPAMQAYNKATILGVSPQVVGTLIMCADCARPYDICVSTGTGANQWRLLSGATGCQ